MSSNLVLLISLLRYYSPNDAARDADGILNVSEPICIAICRLILFSWKKSDCTRASSSNRPLTRCSNFGRKVKALSLELVVQGVLVIMVHPAMFSFHYRIQAN